MPPLVFVHGWGFDRSIWREIVERLPGQDCTAIDLGYFADPQPMPSRLERPIFVGHSFGAMWLLNYIAETRMPVSGFVSIGGFPRFTQIEDYHPAVATRIVSRMIARFQRDPQGVLSEFREKCGVTATQDELDHLRFNPLRQGLEALSTGDLRPILRLIRCPVLSLGARDDEIVPQAMAEHAFSDAHAADYEWLDTGGHCLPLSAADWCASKITAFATSVDANQ